MGDISKDRSALLDKLISDCINYGLSVAEGLEYINREYGTVSHRTYFRRRAKIMSEDTCKSWLSHFTRIGYIQHQKKQMDIMETMQGDSLGALFRESAGNPRNENLILRIKSDIRATSELLSAYAVGPPMQAAFAARLKMKGLDDLVQDHDSKFLDHLMNRTTIIRDTLK